MLLYRDQKKALSNFLLTNKWPDKEAEQHDKDVPQSICPLEVE